MKLAVKCMKNSIFIYCFSVFFCFCSKAQENWHQFRGPNGQGISQATGIPETWDAEKNIVWKTDIPGEGWSSPIVWNNHVFLTTTTENGKNCHVIAVDCKTGNILWDKVVFTQDAEQHRHPMNSYATPTPVTDGITVFAVFSGGSIVAMDFDGNIIWINSDLDYYSHHGMGTSPILYNDLFILAVNPSNREESKQLGWLIPWDKSYLLAIDKNTGKERWRGKREMSRIAHSTPITMNVNGKVQIISVAGDVIQGFDPSNGELIWTVRGEGEPCVPTPAIGDNMIFSTTAGTQPIRAVRPDGKGECTETHLIWEKKGQSPMMASFLYVKPCLYTCTENGYFNCLNAESGELFWQLQLKIGVLNPSPLFVDGKFYILSEQGTTIVLKPADDPKTPAEIIATNKLNEHCRTSIAVAGKRLLIRSDNHLWCIGNK